MSFPRGCIIALMAGLTAHGDGDAADLFVVALIGQALWWLAPDPLPGAIKRGLEDFAREYRR